MCLCSTVLNGLSSKKEIPLQLSGSELIAVQATQASRAPPLPDVFVSLTSNSARQRIIPIRVTQYMECWGFFVVVFVFSDLIRV